MAVEYIQGAELPDVAVTWQDEETGLLDFSTGWTFTARIGQPGSVAEITKTTGISGAAIAPNVIIAWTADELDSLAPGSYTVDLEAKNTGSSKDRKRSFQMTILPQVLPTP